MDRLVAGLELKRRAYQGDAKAMYEYAFRINDRAESWKYRCLAANQNYPDAQALVANHHRWGLDPVEQDLLKAFVWYRLAESNGYKGGKYTGSPWEGGSKYYKPFSEVLANDMTPPELADGERLVSKWKPNPAECEGEAKLAAD
jgi:TPR repeat protein